jgi:predicted PurR-regulated permease PerM
MNQSWPFYARLALILFTIWLILYGIYIGQDILLPFGFAFLIAVLLQPLEKFFRRFKTPRVIAILIAILTAFIFLFSLITFISHQISSFVNDVPAIEKNLTHFFNEVQIWISKTFHFTKQQQQQVLDKAKQENGDTATVIATSTLSALTASLLSLTLVPIYVFLFLYYRNHLLMFIIHLFNEKHSGQVSKVIMEIRSVVQQYVTGLLIETSCVAVLNCVGLLLIGAPYPILLGVIGAILNLIPYIGGLIAVALTGIIALINTGDPYIMLASIGVYLVVQFIDNNFFVPRIIGSSVQLNALVSIAAVLIGGALCGVGGMFLSLPFMAIFKVICDHVDNLKPWGMLLGDAEQARWRLLRIPSMKAIKKKESSQENIKKKVG